MTETIKESVLANVEAGVKGTELVVNVVADLRKKDHDYMAHQILSTIDQMVNDGDILEVEYILPHIDYRIKSFYLPVGTKIRIKEGIES